MEENKNIQAETVGEEQLEEVAGGIFGTSDVCYFKQKFAEKDNPIALYVHTKEINGKRYAECYSSCLGGLNYCSCHGTDRCIDKWHVIEGSGLEWRLSPAGKYNHSHSSKNIRVV